MNKPTDEQWCLPSCHHQKEDYWHFFEYPHPTRVLEFVNYQLNLLKLHQKYSVDTMHLFQLLWEGL